MLIRIGDCVRIVGLEITGIVENIRYDSKGEAIYDIELFNPEETPTGTYIARDYELVKEAE